MSLVEMLVVMTVAAVMVGLAVTTIHLLLGAEHEATKGVRYSTSVARLARAFREDIHAARAIEMPPPDPGKAESLVATAAGGRRVRYELDSHRATRVESDGADEVHRDDFHFSPGSRLEFSHPGEPGLVRLTIRMAVGGQGANRKEGASSEAPGQTLVIEAVPSRIQRAGLTGGNND